MRTVIIEKTDEEEMVMRSDRTPRAGRGPAMIFWLWLTMTFGGLVLMLVIVTASS